MKNDERYDRELERRKMALRVCVSLGDTPEMRRKVALAFGVTERTLRRWAQRQRSGESLVKKRGRPPEPVAREQRQGLIAALWKLGPCAGVKVLRGLFRSVPYRTIAKLKRRFVSMLQRRHGWHRKRLRWRRAGAVWATDFTQPRAQLPASNRRLCLVRDLASGAQLAALPCKGERARVACAVLAALFVTLGPPLVVKHDNGSAFRAGRTQELFEQHGVVALYSPPYVPQYNGACERSGGTLKQRVKHVAWTRGHGDHWTQADIAEALWQANTTARPRGATRPTPAQAFASRQPIDPQEREAFQQTRAQELARAVETHKAKHGKMPTRAQRAAIRRKATQHALCKNGYLDFRKGRLSTPLSSWKAGRKA